MKKSGLMMAVLAAGAMCVGSQYAKAAIVITEVDPSGSGTTNSYNQDWFELTNTGTSAVDITGWTMDDNSHTFANSVALRGVTSIAPGQSVVFVEDGTDPTADAAEDAKFEAFWFGTNIPAGFTIGNYGGSGVGLSATADEVNIYNASGAEVVGVGFNASTAGSSFDNVAGLGGSTQPDVIISTISSAGVNGAFASVGTVNGVSEIGSPGTIGTSAVPEPASLGLLGLGVVGMISRRRRA